MDPLVTPRRTLGWYRVAPCFSRRSIESTVAIQRPLKLGATIARVCGTFVGRWARASALAYVLAGAGLHGRELFGAQNGFQISAFERKGLEVALRDERLQVRVAARGTDPTRRALVFPLDAGARDLSAYRYVECEIANHSAAPAAFSFWALSDEGWGGVSTFSTTKNEKGRETLAPGAREVFRIDLHARYSGPTAYTKAIDPASVRRLELIFENDRAPIELELEAVRVVGRGPDEPHDTSRRVRVPEITRDAPAAGRRVYQALPGWEQTEVRHVLTLPREWQAGKRWPVIVEYPGNVFYHKYCYSTGKTDQGKLGYGLARGEKFIVLNLPFISEDGQREQIDGWGDIEKAIGYCHAALKFVEQTYGADPRAVFFTGFSRGSYAANYLALRNDRIAGVWAGFLTLRDPGAQWPNPAQKGWRGIGAGWNERAARMRGRPWCHQPDELGAEVHAEVEFLEDRPSAVATRRTLREWAERAMGR